MNLNKTLLAGLAGSLLSIATAHADEPVASIAAPAAPTDRFTDHPLAVTLLGGATATGPMAAEIQLNLGRYVVVASQFGRDADTPVADLAGKLRLQKAWDAFAIGGALGLSSSGSTAELVAEYRTERGWIGQAFVGSMGPVFGDDDLTDDDDMKETLAGLGIGHSLF